MRDMDKFNEKDNLAAIGIGAMIVFIALTLVAAVAATVIIQTAEKLQQNAQQTGSDTQEEIGGKINVLTIYVSDTANDVVTIIFEPSSGSDSIAASGVTYQIFCQNGGSTEIVANTFDSAVDNDLAATTLAGGAATSFSPGVVYKKVIDTSPAGAGTDCAPSVSEDHTLWLHVDGGGSTYEILHYTSTDDGTIVV